MAVWELVALRTYHCDDVWECLLCREDGRPGEAKKDVLQGETVRCWRVLKR